MRNTVCMGYQVLLWYGFALLLRAIRHVGSALAERAGTLLTSRTGCQRMKDCSLEEAGDEGAERLQTRLEKWSMAQKTGGLINVWPNSPLALVSTHKCHAGRCEAAGRRPYQHVRCFAVGRDCLCRAGLYSTHGPTL